MEGRIRNCLDHDEMSCPDETEYRNSCDEGPDNIYGVHCGSLSQSEVSKEATCGFGREVVYTYCNDPHDYSCSEFVAEEAKETYHTMFPCDYDCCPNGWGEWMPWSACHLEDSCIGSGERFRNRTCDAPKSPDCAVEGEWGHCTDVSTTWGACNKIWSEWQPWSDCCGLGWQHRERECSFLGAMYGNPVHDGSGHGDICHPEFEDRECDDDYCGECCRHWVDWSPWSGCDATCGIGTSARTRLCLEPLWPGCESEDEFEECDSGNDCQCSCQNWSPWSDWDCECGTGNGKRFRECADGFCELTESEEDMCVNAADSCNSGMTIFNHKRNC